LAIAPAAVLHQRPAVGCLCDLGAQPREQHNGGLLGRYAQHSTALDSMAQQNMAICRPFACWTPSLPSARQLVIAVIPTEISHYRSRPYRSRGDLTLCVRDRPDGSAAETFPADPSTRPGLTCSPMHMRASSSDADHIQETHRCSE